MFWIVEYSKTYSCGGEEAFFIVKAESQGEALDKVISNSKDEIKYYHLTAYPVDDSLEEVYQISWREWSH